MIERVLPGSTTADLDHDSTTPRLIVGRSGTATRDTRSDTMSDTRGDTMSGARR